MLLDILTTQPPDFLHDPIWQFIGVVVAVIALGITVWLYRLQRRHKEILWEIILSTSIKSFNISNKLKTTVVYNGDSLEDVTLIQLKIWNAGNTEILSGDFDVPISINFGKGVNLLEADVKETVPNSITKQVSLKCDSDSITLMPLPLNSKDSITLNVLLTKFTGNTDEIKVDAHIIGAKIRKPGEDDPYAVTVGSALFKTSLIVLGFLIVTLICALTFQLMNTVLTP